MRREKLATPVPLAEPIPARIVPMLARLSRLPIPGDDYAYEIKWDGIRAIFFCETGHIRIQSRNLLDITRQYPELQALGQSLRSARAILDGEIIAPDEKGRPSFERLQGRMHLSPERVAQRAQSIPIIYMIFDLLYLGEHSAMALPYTERRRLLEGLGLSGPSWQTPAYHIGDGAALLEESRKAGFEGIIAKKVDSCYEPGRRSGAWRKIKNTLRQECVIGGWLPGEGARAGRLGSLLAGYYDLSPREAARRGQQQKFVFAGKVGTGFSDAALDNLMKALRPLRRGSSPFEVNSPKYKNAVYVEPLLAAEVEFTEWTAQFIMRHPSFKGLRTDKLPRDIVREQFES